MSFKTDETIELPFEIDTTKTILVTGSFHSWHGNDWLLPVAQALGKGPWKMVLSGHSERSYAIYEKLKKEAPFPSTARAS